MSKLMGEAVNVLITSAAAKVLLVQAFRDAPGIGKVYAGDLNPDVAARHAADGMIELPRSDHPGFVKTLLEVATTRRIGLIVPTRDPELPILAAARTGFRAAGVEIHVPSPQTIHLCQNKRLFAAFCAEKGLPTLPALTQAEARSRLQSGMPVFCRPITGAGGAGACRIDAEHQFPADWDGHIVTDLIETRKNTSAPGAIEYSVDLLRDLDGTRTIGVVVRTREDVQGGESQRSAVVLHPAIEAVAREAAEALGLVGHNTLQFFDDPDRGPLLIEINPRFGGAGNLGIRAGLDSPRRLTGMLRNDPTAFASPEIAIGMRMLRYKQDFLLGADGTLIS